MYYRNISNLDHFILRYSSEKVLIIMRGLPGSGKSYKAQQLSKELNAPVFGSDDFFMEEEEYKFDPSKIVEAHQWNQSRVEDAMKKNIPIIIVDNTNTKLYEAKPYAILAQKYGYEIRIEEPESDWWKEHFKKDMSEEDIDKFVDVLDRKNTHNVPPHVIKQMAQGWDYDPTVEGMLQSKAPWE